MNLIKQSDTTKPILVLMVDSTDHVTGATGKTLAVTRSKNGAAFAAWAGSATELANGWYSITPAAGDVDTLGELALHVTATGCDPADVKYTVVAFNPFDASALGLSRIDAAITSRADGANYTGTRAAKLDNLDAAITSRPAATDYTPTRAAKLDNLDATITSRPAALDYTPARAAKLDNLNNLDAAVTTRASAADYTALRAAKLDNLDATITSRASATDYTALRAAKLDNLDATITSRPAGIDYTPARAALIDRLDAAISTRLAAADYSAGGSDPATIAAAVWDELIAGHVSAGSTGAKLNAAGAAGDPWTADLSLGGYSGEMAGKYLRDARDKAMLITAGGVVITDPVEALTGDFNVIRGDDYTAATGRALPQWSSADWSPFLLTTAISVTFKAKSRLSDAVFTQAITVISDTQVQLELTAAQIDSLRASGREYTFDIEAILSGGEVVTLVQGGMRILEDVR